MIAGSPIVDLSSVRLNAIWGYRATHDDSGNPFLGERDYKLLTATVLARCDLDDGVKDGIVGDPAHCSFDPGELECKPQINGQCLGQAQVYAIKKIYAGAMNSKGEKLTPGGPFPGSEFGSRMQYLGGNAESLTVNEYRYLFLWPPPGVTWKVNDFDFDRDYQRTGLMQVLVDASNPDLRRFKAAGGKLLAYDGMNDSVLPRALIDYYETVERTMGGRNATQDFFRLFMLPGVGHCGGGEGASEIDYLSYLENWVERGRAPDKMIAAHRDWEQFLTTHDPNSRDFVAEWEQFSADSKNVKFTRPVYPYPMRVKYTGHGNPNDAANFRAIGPLESK